MKKVSFKSITVITLLCASVMVTPAMVAGYGNDDDRITFNQGISDPDQLMSIFGGFGSALGGLGYGGQIIGRVFEMLLMQTLTNFSSKEIIPGVYALSAFEEEHFNGTKSFSGESEYYLPHLGYDQSALPGENYTYCEVVKQGYVNYTITIGAGVTLLIYDQDKSFIKALEKIIAFVDKIMNPETFNESNIDALISEGVEVLTWFLIHINDIFTGEELFALNPITWQNMKLESGPTYSLTKTWRVTDDEFLSPSDDTLETVMGASAADAMLDDWNATAIARKDSYMQWLLRTTDDVSLVEEHYTSFTFDLIQLWVKNFEVHIDAAAILDLITGGGGGMVDVAAIFEGLKVEFFLFTHHLGGVFLYNDSNDDGMITTSYENLTIGGNPITIDGVPVQVPRTTEVTHRIMLGTVDDFEYELPHKTGTNKISWGLRLNDVSIVPVPVGVDLESYLGSAEENLDYIHFGFSFSPYEIAPGILYAPVKLDQFFAPWNGLETYSTNNDIADLDLAIIYLSTMLHFKLDIETQGEDPDDPATYLDPADDYNNETHELKVGNYLGRAFRNELAFVDIAGPFYEHGTESSRTQADASSAIIPLALYNAEVERHDTFEDESGEEFVTFATDISLNVSFNVMAYAVCFPEFEGGNGIWHDPTFSVFMVFEAQGFWAIILLVAGVGLVGIATILIKRRKDARF